MGIWRVAAVAAASSLNLAQSAGFTFWVHGSGGASCDTVCKARGGCREDVWPRNMEEFNAIVDSTRGICEETQEGGATYDPSSDGTYCGWKGPDKEHMKEGTSRCGANPLDSGTYRWCPCISDKEL
eukprot:gnl/TRDRNA2_/TRDRNA2_49413_c0_seq1.p2 gnl/TRDRNA2_/TRDRNA2_49413_c0~~gnl/TRDRNA2_/TRDRNA2_49413_c0_seq1.p2  ORF type:complete len:126 (+),score=13.53 gnl/TRDRNA2_/TRDRNA2_49413_c0_seq1:15-392(+)